MAQNVTAENFDEEVINAKIPVLIDFWAPWCGPCQMLSPTVDEIAKSYGDRLKVCKVNVDEASEIATQYAVMSIPALMIFKNGEIMEKRVGAMSKDNLEEFIQPYL